MINSHLAKGQKPQGERIKFSHGAGVKSGQFLRQPLFQGFRHA
jgi:hypothetical protein